MEQIVLNASLDGSLLWQINQYESYANCDMIMVLNCGGYPKEKIALYVFPFRFQKNW